MASDENIKVYVRLRPFLQNLREESDGRAKRIVEMDELSSTVSVTNPENPADIHRFSCDNLFWSFDGYSEQTDGYLSPENKSPEAEEIFCDQKQVYDEIGKSLVHNLWAGYNSTLFTFGERKSGKSWTLLGLGSNKGIVPQSLTDLFKSVREKDKASQQNGTSIEVRLSMAEVYNERIKDLLPAPATSTKFKNTVKIREHSKKGFYIEGLRNVLVLNHEDVQQRLEEGLTNRAIYLTNINATAGNSLTLISVTLVQKIRNHRGDELTRMATLEFIDLPAGEFSKFKKSPNQIYSEHVESDITEPYSTLRKNGIQYLSSCVDWLLEASIGKVVIDASPFSGHNVVKILRNALVGNTKSCMMLTVNPSDYAFENTIFALEFAEKVRMLTTRPIPVVNEDVTSKLIRELKGENEKLRKMVSFGEIDINELHAHLGQLALLSSSEREIIKRKVAEDMKGQIRENEKELRNLQQPFEERLKSFKNEKNDLGKKIENDRKNKCHLFNLHEDSQITGKIINIIPLGTIDFGGHSINTNGNGKGRDNHFIPFYGPGIMEHHGTFSFNNKEAKISIKPAGPSCKIQVNEVSIQFDTALTNNDRITLGGNQVWVYQNPKETWMEKYALSSKLHYTYVVEEIAMKTELFKNLLQQEATSESLQKQFLLLLPALEEAKSMTQDLSQNFTFKPLLCHSINDILYKRNAGLSPSYTKLNDFRGSAEFGSATGSPQVLLKVQNSIDGQYSYWSLSKFFLRLETLKESYMQFVEDAEVPLKEIDAFKESPEANLPIGYSIVCLKPLAYLINIDKPSVPILDFVDFHVIGSVNVSICIWDESGDKVNDNEIFIASPDELLDQHLAFGITIRDIQPTVTYHFKDIHCKYRFLGEKEDVTKYLDSKSNFTGLTNKHEKKFILGALTDNTLNYLLAQFLVLRFYGKQRAHKLLNLSDNLESHVQTCFGINGHLPDPAELERTLAQLKIKEKAEQRQLHRLNALKALVDQTESVGEQVIPVSVMKTMFEAKSQKLAEQNLEEHLETITAVPAEDPEKHLAPELKALKRFSEVCNIV